jgi:hypothetical protein
MPGLSSLGSRQWVLVVAFGHKQVVSTDAVRVGGGLDSFLDAYVNV